MQMNSSLFTFQASGFFDLLLGDEAEPRFVLSSSLLMSDSEPELSYIIQASLSQEHFAIVLAPSAVQQDSRSPAIARRTYESVLCIFLK